VGRSTLSPDRSNKQWPLCYPKASEYIKKPTQQLNLEANIRQSFHKCICLLSRHMVSFQHIQSIRPIIKTGLILRNVLPESLMTPHNWKGKEWSGWWLSVRRRMSFWQSNVRGKRASTCSNLHNLGNFDCKINATLIQYMDLRASAHKPRNSPCSGKSSYPARIGIFTVLST